MQEWDALMECSNGMWERDAGLPPVPRAASTTQHWRLTPCSVSPLQPDLRVPRQGPQHLRCFLLLRLLLEHVLQRLQIRPQQNSPQVQAGGR